MKKLTVIGAGKLGLPMGACFAEANYKVKFYDSSKGKIENLSKHLGYNYEKGLNNLLYKNSKRIHFTSNIEDAFQFSNFFFVILPTPSLKNGNYSLIYIKSFLKKLCILLKKNPKEVNIVITSTVMPGSCDNKLIPFIKKNLSKSLFQKINLYYSPEFIALGSVVNDLQRPRIVLVGSNNPKKASALSNFYKSIIKNKPKVFETNLKTAELAKILINSFMTVKISFSNYVGLLSNNDKDLDSKKLLESLKIFNLNNSKGYLSGVGYSGPCLPRDNRSVAFYSSSKKIHPFLSNSADKVNKEVNNNLYIQIKKYSKDCKNIAFLGISYKEQTSVIEESPMLYIIHKLKKNFNIIIYDPLVHNESNISRSFNFNKNLKNVIEESDLLVIYHKSINLDKYKNILKYKKIFHVWGNRFSIGLID